MIAVAVGTFIHGFDTLVTAADEAATALGLTGFAQIGYSSEQPRRLAWLRFLPHEDLIARLRQSELLISHAGMGLIGDGLRTGCRLIVVPRRGSTSHANPANDQLAVARRLATMLPLTVCEEPHELTGIVRRVLGAPRPSPSALASNVPHLIAGFLAEA